MNFKKKSDLTGHAHILTINGKEITNQIEIENEINNYFVNVGPTLSKKILTLSS